MSCRWERIKIENRCKNSRKIKKIDGEIIIERMN